MLQFSADKKPVVVWNVTRGCNLRCVHCYSQSECRSYPDEMSTKEGMKLIDDLADFGCPVLLLSGGEPLIRKDVPELARHARAKGLRVVISTNGTLITPELADELQKIGVSYVGVSLDGMRPTNDAFRGVEGAFDKAMVGIRNCQEKGIKVGLRFTINKRNAADIPALFDLMEEREIPRVCFYHLVYSGRAVDLMKEDLDHVETRRVVDLIIDRTADLHKRGRAVEVLTVDNHTDGVYLYQRMRREGNPRADQVLELLRMNGGNSTGVGIGCVSWNGDVHPDQFWRHYTFGNVRQRPFGEIWTDRSDPVMNILKDRKDHLKGRCGLCHFKDACNGNFRVRAEAVTGDIWEADPACYLSDVEIGIAKE
jgi:12,18-didecarboxysiroheme deacetylase